MPLDNDRNQFVDSGPIADLAGGATLADVIAKVNEMLAAMRASGSISG